MLISSSNFLFPVETFTLNASILQQSIERDVRRIDKQTLSFENFFNSLTPDLKDAIRQKVFFYILNMAILIIFLDLRCNLEGGKGHENLARLAYMDKKVQYATPFSAKNDKLTNGSTIKCIIKLINDPIINATK